MRILTFDVEDWFHVLDNQVTRGPAQWRGFESRIQGNVDRLLAILEERGVRATFFCLGWVAERHPEVVRKIHRLGHEIGTHSYAHQLVYEQTPAEFVSDLERSLVVLEDAIGEKVCAYRAPGFSLTRDCRWLFDELLAHGIGVDCSVFPAARAHGGFPEFGACAPALIETRAGPLKEFPISVWEGLGLKLVFSGGGYFRLLPYPLIRALTRRSPYLMTYFHPRDFDPDQPMVPGLGVLRRFKSYYGLGAAEAKLKRLLDDFQFIDLRTAVGQVDWARARRLTLT